MINHDAYECAKDPEVRRVAMWARDTVVEINVKRGVERKWAEFSTDLQIEMIYKKLDNAAAEAQAHV